MGNNRSNSNGTGLLFLAGAIAGGAAMYFMQTPKGRKIRAALAEQADLITSEVKHKASDAVATVKSTADSVLASANSAMTTAREKVVGLANTAENKGENEIDEFRQGIDRAEQHIQNALDA